VSALAPAIAALTGFGLVALVGWTRESWAGLAALALGVGLSAWVAVMVLSRTPDFAPWLRTLIPAASALAMLGAVALRLRLRPRPALAIAAVTATLALAAGPAAYSVATVGRSLADNNVLAGPASAGAGFGGGRGGFGGPPSGFGGPGGASAGGNALPAGPPPTGASSSGGGFGPDGGGVSSTLVKYLEAHQGSAKYLVAASGSMTTAPIIIQTGKAVVTIGGFNGRDPAPTVARLEQMVAKGELKYVLLGGGGFGGGPGGGQSSSALQAWVQQHGTAVSGVSTGGATLYEVSA
jgi:4-amino-4-deoxy-L-arabinose transferase-like glycosyltransferase